MEVLAGHRFTWGQHRVDVCCDGKRLINLPTLLIKCAHYTNLHNMNQSIAPRYITASETALCGLLEVILGPLFVFFAYNVVPGKWTLIGGSLLLIVLAAHESIPLFSKSREMYRRFSKRLSSEIGNDDKETQHMLAETLIGNGDEEIS